MLHISLLSSLARSVASNSAHDSLSSQTFIIGIGSNKGDKLLNLRQAVEKIKEDKDIVLIETSRIYKTEAHMLPNSSQEWNIPFFNGAVKVETTLSASVLLERLKRIEGQLGRPPRHEKWGPRVIDLDILSCGQKIIEWPEPKSIGEIADNSSHLRIPHASLLERSFALIPLLDLEPSWSHPQHPSKDLGSLAESLGSIETLPYPLDGTKIMGVLNLTPISMSGPNKLLTADEIQEAVVQMVNDGAEIIDVGAESTRPRSSAISPETEWERLQPFIMNLEKILSDPHLLIRPLISIDTYHWETVQKLRAFPIDIINDVSGAEKERIIPFLKGTNIKYVLMHNEGKAGVRHINCRDEETIIRMMSWFEQQMQKLITLGMTKDQIIIDPGVGFGKKKGHTASIIKDIVQFKTLGCPILVGHSRKASALPYAASMLPPLERDLETAWLSKELSKKRIDIVRVHNVSLNRRMMDEKISLIVAHQNDRGMGIGGEIPWSIREDMNHFRETTQGKTILMGRKTFESIGRPLPLRRNVVLSKTLPVTTKGVEVYRSLQEAFSNIHPKEEVFVIGGENVFAAILPHADVIYRTLVQSHVPVDVYFPRISDASWQLVAERRIEQDKENEYPFTIQTLKAVSV